MESTMTFPRRELHEIETQGQRKLQEIVQADTAYQNEVGARGGQVTTSLTPDSEEAANRVQADLQRRRARLVAPVRDRAHVEHRRLFEIAKQDAIKAAESQRALANFEDAASSFFAAAHEPGLLGIVADRNLPLQLDGFVLRESRIVPAPLTPLAKLRQSPLARLNFAHLFGGE